MTTRFLLFLSFIFLIFSCQEQQPAFTVHATIQSGAGKYIKYIDMSQLGLKPDSLAIDISGKFDFTQKATQPKDLIFFFDDKEYIRLVLCPNEIVTLTATATNLVATYTVTGSQESADVSMILKRHFRAVNILDTLQQFYLKNQTNPELDRIVEKLSFISDSVYTDEKAFLKSFIENNPGSIASYISLSQKLGYNQQLFTLINDLPYFEMVDTAMVSRYGNIAINKMLHTYVTHGKLQIKQEKEKAQNESIFTQAPEVRLPNAFGDTLALSELKGKYVLIDFWGSWCRPCRLGNKTLRDVYRKYRYRGFEIFQIAIERNANDWKNTIKEDKLYWKYQVSELNYMESKTAKDFCVKSIPSNILINADGKIIGRNLYGTDLTTKLDSLLKPMPFVIPSNSAAPDSIMLDSLLKPAPIAIPSIQ